MHTLHGCLGMTPGIKFSSGRLGHMWPAVNGVAVANKDKSVFCLGSDGSQMEGNDAEAARLAVSENLNVKLIVDDAIAGGTNVDASRTQLEVESKKKASV